jgi:hypothetical protein
MESFTGRTQGQARYPAHYSSEQMLEEAQESRIEKTQQWHDDRRAQRDAQRAQPLPGGSIPVAAASSRIKCQICDVYIETEMNGTSYTLKSIYFYPVQHALVKMATKTCVVHHQILIICAGCARRKKTPEQWRETDRHKIGLPPEYAVVKATEASWSRFATHTDLKEWLWWMRRLCECLIFYPILFRAEITRVLAQGKNQITPEVLSSPLSLQHVGTLSGLPVASDESTTQHLLPVAQTCASPVMKQLLLEQQRLKRLSTQED